MKYDPNKHHRRSIRLRDYDYSQEGAYFVTMCTQNRECLFGDVVDEEMALNDAGKMIKTVWDEIPQFYCGIETDELIIMPNHIHGIIIIVGAGPRACPDRHRACPDDVSQPNQTGQPQGVAPTLSLPDVVHRYKTMTTKRYTDCVKQDHWPPFPGKLWQRNYYDHIIRNEKKLNKIREYITHNPLNWEMDVYFKNRQIINHVTLTNQDRIWKPENFPR